MKPKGVLRVYRHYCTKKAGQFHDTLYGPKKGTSIHTARLSAYRDHGPVGYARAPGSPAPERHSKYFFARGHTVSAVVATKTPVIVASYLMPKLASTTASTATYYAVCTTYRTSSMYPPTLQTFWPNTDHLAPLTIDCSTSACHLSLSSRT